MRHRCTRRNRLAAGPNLPLPESSSNDTSRSKINGGKMNRNRLQIVAICAFAFVLVFATLAGAQAAKVDGKWDMTVDGGQRGPQTSSLMLKADGGKLTGVLTGGRGDTPVT